VNFQIARSRRNLFTISRIEISEVERSHFGLQKSRSYELRGLVQHVAHLLGGTCVVDRKRENKSLGERKK
jgi:hypothetical protein